MFNTLLLVVVVLGFRIVVVAFFHFVLGTFTFLVIHTVCVRCAMCDVRVQNACVSMQCALCVRVCVCVRIDMHAHVLLSFSILISMSLEYFSSLCVSYFPLSQ